MILIGSFGFSQSTAHAATEPEKKFSLFGFEPMTLLKAATPAIATALPGGGFITNAMQFGQLAEYRNAAATAKGETVYKRCFNTGEITTFFGFSMEGCLAQASYIVLWLSSWYLWLGAWFFNATLTYSLNMGQFLKNVPIVDMGWKIFRDVANLCFIFILLYIAINTILKSKTADVKRLLIRVIVVAILLNFSLFFAKVVIDSSNILAIQFYENLVPDKGDNKNIDKGISQTFLNSLGLNSVYTAGRDGTDAIDDSKIVQTTKNIIFVTLGGSVLIVVTAFVFFASAIMFIIRTIVLIFLLILSPLAFICMVIPNMEGQFKKWLGMLLNQAFFAPAYLMMVYLVMTLLTGSFVAPDKRQVNLATFLSGNPESVGTLYVFVVLIGLMLGSLFIAKNMGAIGGDFARNMAGKATFGAGAWMGRQTIGRLAQRTINNSERLQRWKDGNLAQRSAFNFVDRRAKGTFDVRNSAVAKAAESQAGSFGTAGGVGGFQKEKEDQKKRETSLAKTIAIQRKKNELQTAMATSGAGRDAAIQAALNSMTDSEYVELGGSVITNPDIVRNARHSQIEASTNEKNEKLNETQKATIKTSRLQELSNARNGVAGSRTIKQVLDDMSDAEKAALPEEYLRDHRVFMHFNKNTRELIGKSSLTAVQKQALGNSRSQALLEATGLAPMTATSPTPGAVGSLVKIMTGKELFRLHEAPGPGHDILLRADVVDNLTVPQLKELAEIDNFTPALRSRIGNYIRTQPTHPSFYYVKQPIVPMGAPAGTPAVAGEGFAQWS